MLKYLKYFILYKKYINIYHTSIYRRNAFYLRTLTSLKPNLEVCNTFCAVAVYCLSCSVFASSQLRHDTPVKNVLIIYLLIIRTCCVHDKSNISPTPSSEKRLANRAGVAHYSSTSFAPWPYRNFTAVSLRRVSCSSLITQ